MKRKYKMQSEVYFNSSPITDTINLPLSSFFMEWQHGIVYRNFYLQSTKLRCQGYKELRKMALYHLKSVACTNAQL